MRKESGSLRWRGGRGMLSCSIGSAFVYFKQRQYEKALRMLKRSEALDSNRSDIHFDIALVELSQDQYPSAATELEKAINWIRRHRSPTCCWDARIEHQPHVKAIEQFQAALRLDPNYSSGSLSPWICLCQSGAQPGGDSRIPDGAQQSPENPSVFISLATVNWRPETGSPRSPT